MIIIPSIDILNGSCVRLYQGKYNQATVYSKDPVEIAHSFEDAGARRIHIIDLDAARGEGRNNRKKIGLIRKAVGATIEVGGGIRTPIDVEELLSIGIDKLILGTVLAQQPTAVASWVKEYGDVFIAGIDAVNGNVKISGWEDNAGVDDVGLACEARDIGFTGIIYTNIAHDGALDGPDIDRTALIAEQSKLPVILSGGIGSEADVEAVVRKAHPGIIGIIIGKAIYEGKVSLPGLLESYH
ncbi:MAG: 1-(5-phosphoribosyl)-5-[(5-phosphoribosylamino)methylideneamino]imidazole-4-carboxamide isomerase [Spirochaetales bacterium]|nr:1-(5-phosphoribosyl)-5-[(5-phosphoribosylamino)methylideneamino]imidazole-4-carboxamide isomerase [Spirochaetales bacterium]